MVLRVSPGATVWEPVGADAAADGLRGRAVRGATSCVEVGVDEASDDSESPEDLDDVEDVEDFEPDDPEFAELLVCPVFVEQVGQALMPCSALTFSATWICSPRLAFSGEPEPPKAFHVDGVNCSPPEKPLPVSVLQLPPLSHWASASQSVSACAGTARARGAAARAPASPTWAIRRPRARVSDSGFVRVIDLSPHRAARDGRTGGSSTGSTRSTAEGASSVGEDPDNPAPGPVLTPVRSATFSLGVPDAAGQGVGAAAPGCLDHPYGAARPDSTERSALGKERGCRCCQVPDERERRPRRVVAGQTEKIHECHPCNRKMTNRPYVRGLTLSDNERPGSAAGGDAHSVAAPARVGDAGRVTVSTAPGDLSNPADVARALGRTGYLADTGLASAAFLALRMGRPLFCEGEPGTGKTALAQALAEVLGAPLVRLQCHEGIDASQALYDWDFPRQLLHLRAMEATASASHRELDAQAVEDSLYDRRFLLARPILQALQTTPSVLLVDEIDRADDEFEAFLLEVLAENTVTIPEIGVVRADTPPLVVLTSNRTREVHDALKRRCLYLWIEHPDLARETAILRTRLPHVSEALAEQVARAVQRLRAMDLLKPPGVAESLDWARALELLGARRLDLESATATLGAVLKYREDADRARDKLDALLAS